MHVTSLSAVNFTRDVFEITKVQTEYNIYQRLEKFASCWKDLLVLMTSSLFLRRHNHNICYFKNLTQNSLSKQKILLLSLTKQFLDRGQTCTPFRY